MKILALEASTSSAKAMLYDVGTKQFETITHAYEKDYTRADRPLQAEETFQQMLLTGRGLIEKVDAKNGGGSSCADEIEMIALVGVWHSVFLCGKDLVPASPVYHWSHTGASGICKEIRKNRKETEKYYHTSGCMVNAIYPFFKIEMMRRMGLPVGDCFIMSQGAYNTYRMTGRRISTRCLASGDGLLNIHTGNYNWDGLKEYGVQEWQLFELVDSKTAWPVTEQAASVLGVREGIPVLPANSDGGSNQIGAGAARAGVMTFSVGTSAALRLTTEEALIPDEISTWCYLSPKGYLSGAAVNGGCICSDWARQKLFPPGTGYDEIERGITDPDTPPVFLPFLTGERCPGWNDDRTGGFECVKATHNASDLYLGVLEGVLFNLYQCYEALVSVNPQPERIMLSGGILRSKLWTQMCADIFGKEMTVADADQGSLLGGIVLGMEAAGVLADARDYRPKILRVVRPDGGRHEKYMGLYRRYLKYYMMDR